MYADCLSDSQGILAANLWPIHAQVAPEAKDIQTEWQLVPSTFEGVTEWAYLRGSHTQRTRDWTRTYCILYQHPGQHAVSSTHYPLVVRIQGFVKSCNLAPFGNWNGWVIVIHSGTIH